MTLELEVNVVPVGPHLKPYMCRNSEEVVAWDDDAKKAFYHQPIEVHLIKLGPLTEEFLTRKKVGWSKVDFGLDFEVTNDGCYKWTSGPEVKGRPMFHVHGLLDALKSIGYEAERHPEREYAFPVSKYIYKLEKKF